MGHVNGHILTSFFLDRDKYPAARYSKIFEKGVTIRMKSWNPRKGAYTPIPYDNIIPASSGEKTKESFGAFQNWEYSEKMIQQVSSRTNNVISSKGQPNFDDITSWVEHLPEPHTMSEVTGKRQEPLKSTGIELEETFVPHNGTEMYTSIGSLPKATSNVGAVLEAPRAELILEGNDSNTEETLSDPKSQTVSIKQETNSALYKHNTQNQADTAPSNRETRVHTENANSFSLLDTPSEPLVNDLHGDLSDPFLSLYMGAKPSFMARNSSTSVRNNHTDTMASDAQLPPTIADDEDLIDLKVVADVKETRKFHNTMLQKAGSRPKGANSMSKKRMDKGAPSTSNLKSPSKLPSNPSVQQDLDPELLSGINRALVEVLTPLRICPGKLSLKAVIGRFCFTRVNKAHVQLPPPNAPIQPQEPAKLKKALDLHHIGSKALLFTQILTADGGDMNYITQIKEPDGTRMWTPDSSSRRSVYEFPCRAQTEDGRPFGFVLEVDSTDFSYGVHCIDEKPHLLFVHCMKRSWDFQLEVSATQKLERVCEKFSKDLVESLRVM